MLSHVEMAPVAGGFKLFGKVITQCAESAPPVPVQPPARGARERDDPDERDQPMVKREAAADHDSAEKQQHSGAGGESNGLQPRPRQQQQPQHQDTAEARAASSAPPAVQ